MGWGRGRTQKGGGDKSETIQRHVKYNAGTILGVDMKKYCHTSGTIQGHSRDTSETIYLRTIMELYNSRTTQNHFRKTSEGLQKDFRNTSETIQKQFRDTSGDNSHFQHLLMDISRSILEHVQECCLFFPSKPGNIYTSCRYVLGFWGLHFQNIHETILNYF